MSLSFYIDSATQFAYLALFEEGQMIKTKKVPVGPLSKDDLFEAIDEVADDLKLTYIVLGIGPGSYTGMRVASIIATTLAYSLDIPLVTLTSMDGYDYKEPFAVVFDAKRGNVYLKDNDQVVLTSLDSLRKIDKFLLTPHESLIKGEGRWVLSEPNFDKIGQLSKLKFERKEFTDPKNVNLLYLQTPYT